MTPKWVHLIQVAKQNATLDLLENAKYLVQQTQNCWVIRKLFTSHLEWSVIFVIVIAIFRNISQPREIYKDVQ